VYRRSYQDVWDSMTEKGDTFIKMYKASNGKGIFISGDNVATRYFGQDSLYPTEIRSGYIHKYRVFRYTNLFGDIYRWEDIKIVV
jgi:hypothetical protein